MTTKTVYVGEVPVGGGHPVTVQSMTNTPTADIDTTRRQIQRLEEAGCEIIRVSTPDQKSVEAIAKLKETTRVPIVADIHFKAGLAIGAIEAGADKVRINPGNIGGRKAMEEIVKAAKKKGVPMRIGVNSGSLSGRVRDLDLSLPDKLVASALENIQILEDLDFTDMIISVKSSDVMESVEANRKLAGQVRYPLHLGVTESGPKETGTIKSAVCLGILLEQGIGDTVRVSLAADPVYEVTAAKHIIQAVGLRKFYPEVIACPTCARCEIALFELAERVQDFAMKSGKPIKIAVMGCVVNGPGEAADADIGLAGGRGKGVIFRKGKAVKSVREEQFFDELAKEIENY